MKIIRSTKCSTKFATNKKKIELQTILNEYGKVVNVFIDYFWDKKVDKTQLLKPIVDIPKETEDDYWEYMRLPNESVRYLLIEHYNLDTGFFYKAFEESDLKGTTIDEKSKEMFESYFANSESNNIAETLLLIDVNTLKAYTITKEIKYTRKLII
jgi:hypothetical protein